MKRLAACGLLLALGGMACGGHARDDPARAHRIATLKARHASLWKTFDQGKLPSDPVVAEALGDEREVQVAMRGPRLEELLLEVARRYLDRVELDLPLEANVEAQGDVKVAGPLGIGTVHAGTWSVRLVIHRVTGVLSARTPSLDLASAPRLALALPVSLEKAKGNASLEFQWDSKGIANVVCRDFRVQQRIEGTLIPEVHTFSGALNLEALADRVRATPAFRDVPYRLKVDLTPESWKGVEAALAEQDSFFKCGIALDPRAILPKLRERLLRGFDVRLPKKLFRSFALPASLDRSIPAEDRTVVVQAKSPGLRFRQDGLWFASAVSARVQ